ncbi:MAG: 3-oxoacyl-ACP reductase FabG [Oligoflexia bacterium]|nr:3-oxoacyl-ACP reductase FabG [Oligoflexia bacterium]
MNQTQSKGLALVTGGSRGIGRACCEILSKEGYAVVVHFNSRESEAHAVAERLTGACVVQANLSTVEGVEQLAAFVKERGMPVEVLVNNAGVALDNPLFSASVEEFETTMALNMRATWLLTKRIARMMMRQKRGRIINVSSVIGHMGNVGQTVYAMSKAAIDGFTKSAALELAPHGILVNSVAPGFVETDMTAALSAEHRAAIQQRIPLGRTASTAEIAEAVLFFATKASYCTGTVLHVNGGLYAA